LNLDRELRHTSEDIEDDVLLDAVRAIRHRVRVVNRDYDIPYIAGYSRDGSTVFIDRHLPRSFRWLAKTVRVELFLLTQEIVEKALLDELRIALSSRSSDCPAGGAGRREGGRCVLVGLPALHQHERPIEEEVLLRVPARST
jgi:hypothetical protein